MNNETKKNSVPSDILEAIKTSKVYNKLEIIGERHHLLLDQIGQLEVDTRLLMIGKIRSVDFVKRVSNGLGISMTTAERITQDINTEIFVELRESLRKMQEMAEANAGLASPAPTLQPSIPTTPIEKVGNFTIIKPPASQSPQYNHSNLDREAVLHDLENIEKLQPKNANNFVEHLLANPVSNPQQTIVKREGAPATTPTAPPVAQPTPQEPPKQVPVQRKYDADPYREQI